MKLRTSDFRRSRKYAPVRNYEFPYSFYHILLKFLTDKRIKLCKKGSKKT